MLAFSIGSKGKAFSVMCDSEIKIQ
jgi:hypothetical protein